MLHKNELDILRRYLKITRVGRHRITELFGNLGRMGEDTNALKFGTETLTEKRKRLLGKFGRNVEG